MIILALGGSTTWTGYPHYTQAYLDARLQERSSEEEEAIVFNFGVNGWSSLQSLQNYVYLLRYVKPDYIVIHYNYNDLFMDEEAVLQSVIHLPLVGDADRFLIRTSNFYKVLRFAYHLTYNPLVHQKGVVRDDSREISMQSRISSYLNEVDEMAWLGTFFRIPYVPRMRPPSAPRTGETLSRVHGLYSGFVTYAEADGSTLIMTTQYLNFSKGCGDDDLSPEVEGRITTEINWLIRDFSASNDVPLVDLDAEMQQYDPLLLPDCVHFTEEGIRIKGELVGEGVWELLKERYNLED